jgi:hypothetical protein
LFIPLSLPRFDQLERLHEAVLQALQFGNARANGRRPQAETDGIGSSAACEISREICLDSTYVPPPPTDSNSSVIAVSATIDWRNAASTTPTGTATPATHRDTGARL